ncbi:hypothetical protein FHG89_00695, partial [Micromonospora orduensis]
LTGDRDDVAAELQGERFRHDRHPSSEEQILTGQESTEPGAVPPEAGCATRGQAVQGPSRRRSHVETAPSNTRRPRGSHGVKRDGHDWRSPGTHALIAILFKVPRWSAASCSSS